MTFKPDLSTINGVFDSYLLGMQDASKTSYTVIETVPHIVSYLQQFKADTSPDLIATIQTHERAIEQLTNHVSLLTVQLNALTVKK
jgi:hypothetical protein